MLLAGCGASEHDVFVSADIDRVAFLRPAADGTWQSSGLLRVEDRVRAAIGEGETVVVALWSDEALIAKMGALPDDATLAATPLAPRATCQPGLPPPASIEQIGPDEPIQLPTLSASWGGCPDIHSMAARVGCGDAEIECPVRSIDRSGCRYTLHFDCEMRDVEIIRADGDVCAVTPGCTAGRDVEGKFMIKCEANCKNDEAGCLQTGREVACTANVVIDAKLPVETVLTRVHVSQGPSTTPPEGMYNFLQPTSARSGYLGIPVVVGERLIIPFHAYRSNDVCGAGSTTTLVFVSTETASITDTRPTEVCLEMLANDPNGPGFLGLYGDRGSLSIGRFDADGRRVASVQLAAEDKMVARPLLAAQPGLIAVVYASREPTRLKSHLLVIDPVTLAVIRDQTDVGPDISALTLTDDPYVVTVDDFSDLVTWWSPDLATCVGSSNAHLISAPVLRDLSNLPLLDLHYLPEPREILALVNENAAVHQIDNICESPPLPGQSCVPPPEMPEAAACVSGRRAIPPERGFEPIRARPWPALGRKLAVSGTVRPAYRAWEFQAALATYDRDQHEIPPGMIDLGPGIARDLVVDGRGALWVTLPWSGELIRLAVAP